MEQEKLKRFGAQVQRLIERKNLTEEEIYSMFGEALLNEQPDLQQGAFLAALAAKGETTEEIVGAWRAIYELDTIHADPKTPVPLFENSGTGMDVLKTFNVSSAAAIVAAACGVTIARHGARAITSLCGTVDMMEAIGIDVECDVVTVEKSIRTAGIGLFNGTSPRVHPRALGRILSQIRFGSTLNIAASLAHPCLPTLGLRGVYSDAVMEKTVAAMQAVGYERGMVVYGRDAESGCGMDELSTAGESTVIEFACGRQTRTTINPEELGIPRASFADIAATGDKKTEVKRFLNVIRGRGHKGCIDFTCLNAGAILHTAGVSRGIQDGIAASREAIGSGLALEKLRQWATAQDSSGGRGILRLEAALLEAGV
jgi:anthranilate phosphoribosyltransferase